MGQHQAGPTDEQISLLVDIATGGGAGMKPEKLSSALDLVAAGYIESDEGKPDLCKLTPAGFKVLEDRGVGANES